MLFQAVPEATVAWMYKETYVNNGSTLMSDIDMRHYFYIERDVVIAASSSSTNSVKNDPMESFHKRSELFLSATSVDDNGTFACIAKNNAGTARAEFTLHVVVPVPPKPPQVGCLPFNYTAVFVIGNHRSVVILYLNLAF